MQSYKSRPNLCVIDPSLQNTVGHFYEYSRCLFQEAQNRKHGFVILGHRSANTDVRSSLPVEPVFRYSMFDLVWRRRPFRYLDPLPANVAFYQDLTLGLRCRVNRETVLFMPTAGHRELLGWGWWHQQQPLNEKSRLVLLFRMNDYFDSLSGKWWYRNAFWIKLGFRLIEWQSRRRTIRIAVDSQRLAQEFSRLTYLPIEVFPIPHTRAAQGHHPRFARNGNPILRMVFLGNARRDKGFPILAKALQHMVSELRSERFEAVLQCNFYHPDPETVQARDMLSRQNLPNVRLVTESLSTDEYYALLDSSDIVLLPYRRSSYYARTSGILAEAIAAGKPVIVPHDTWMSDQVEHGGGGVLFSDGDVDDLVRAMRQAVNEYTRLRTESESRVANWIVFHNPTTLYDMLLQE